MTMTSDAFAEITRRSGSAKRRKRPVVVAVVAVVGLVAGGLFLAKPAALFGAPARRFVTAIVTRGDLVATTEATGIVQPLLKVTVGAQVSGRVARVHADFNDVVKKGALLAELEPAPMEAELAQSRAALSSSEAQLTKARVDANTQTKSLERVKALVEGGLTARADLDAAQGGFDSANAQVLVAQAQVEQARANVDRARENLSYTKIVAPIEGTIISRTVEPGQTVAASLQAPELFVIANDLTSMQVMASIDEADVGKVESVTSAEVRVDAFPNDMFQGTVRELRVQPTTTSGVVTYPAVIDVKNADRKLRPGMTATVTLTTSSKTGVLRVPNAALRYVGGGGGGRARPAGDDAGAAAAPRAARGKRVFVPPLEPGGAPRAVAVVVGISDGAFTEISGEEIKEGLTVIVDEEGVVAAPPGPRPSGGGGGRTPPRVF
ncbi:MAG: efflux RND transporter periplasmic adaptor subunit [Deltaproteobacteria bacterium]|nr:efflux RND transporter periplasmic adaptor subunit [Deltaproteobacteria bacterium]